jgi:RND family efflux transporter MFP subunit
MRSIAIAALLCAWSPGCGEHGTAEPAAHELSVVSVRVATAQRQTAVVVEEVVGTIRPKQQARLEAKVAGRIEQIDAVPGQEVRQGQLLARLAHEELRAKLDQASAVREQAENDLRRYTELFARSAATPAELDAVQARARVAEAAEAEARTVLGQAEITAPFSGVVTRKLAEVGDLAFPGRAIVELEDPSALRVEAAVGESLIDRIEPGQRLEVSLPTLDAPLTGTVTEIAPAADPASRTFVVKLDLPRTPGLRAGAFARVAVPAGRTEVLRVPAAAVVRRGQLEYVFVAERGKARLRLVRTGKRYGDEIELVAGVEAGEAVVAAGAPQLREGQPLQIEP